MKAGFAIDFGEIHGFWSPTALGFRLLAKQIGAPPKDERAERVPYSNITHYFGESTPSYSERTLTYTYDLVNRDHRNVELLLSELRHKLRWTGLHDLYDSSYPDYHFEARQPVIKAEDGQHTVLTVTITFRTNPAMLPNCVPALLQSEQRYPDVNGDGYITAADAALILSAAEKIAKGESSGLTPAQLLLADADLDGIVTEADSVLILQYVAAVASGQFEDNMQSWQKYLRRHLSMKGALY